MKKTMLSILACWGAWVAALAGPGYTITGHVKGNTDGYKVYLKTREAAEGQLKIIDSTIIHNNTYTFRGQITQPLFAAVVFENKERPDRPDFGKAMGFFLENSPITVTTTTDSLKREFELAYYNYIPLNGATVSGSAAHNAYMAFYAPLKILNDAYDQAFIGKYIKALNSRKDKAIKNKETMASAAEVLQVAGKRTQYCIDYVLQHPVTEVNAYIAGMVATFSGIRQEQLAAMIKHFSSGAPQQGIYTTRFLKDAALLKSGAIGTPIVASQVTKSNGEKVTLSSLIEPGKTTLVVFWASWCHPCRAEIPHLKEIYALYHSKGVNIYSISMDDDKERWQKAMQEENMVWPQFLLEGNFNNDLAKTYNIKGIPTCLFYDASGKLTSKNMRGGFLSNEMVKLYGNLFDNETSN